METREIEIPVPWGHVAGKTWGYDRNTPILVFHGLMDNAASFDRLIPHLPQNYYYICIDLPGHGKSSNFPPFFPYFSINYVLVYQLIMNHFGRKSYTIIAHSYGGQISILLSLLYPERVEKLVLLDTVHFFPVPTGVYLERLKQKFDHILKLNQSNGKVSTPTYSYEEALERIIDGRANFTGSPISREAAKALLSRGLTKIDDNKYQFNVDQRLKSFINPLHDLDYSTKVLKKHSIKCPLLIVFGSIMSVQPKIFEQVLNEYKKKKDFQIEVVDGGHDVHSDSPELVGPIVSKFLLTYKSKL